MTTSTEDICRQLFDSAPTWLVTLSAFTEDGRRRKSSLVDGLATPELSTTHLTTTVGSTSDTATAGSVPGQTRRASNTFLGSHIASPAAQKRDSFHRIEVSRSRGESSSREKSQAVVLYDATAQERLAETVKSMDRLIYHIKKSQQRKSLEAILRSLNKTSNTCEDAAFQLLRNGNCRREAQHASSMIEHLYEHSRREMMEEQLAERLNRRDSAMERSDKPAAPTMPKLVVDSLDPAQDDVRLDMALPALRLTSRYAR